MFQQTNKTKINHINENQMKFEVSLHFGGIWPSVRHVESAIWQMLKNAEKIRVETSLHNGHVCKVNFLLLLSRQSGPSEGLKIRGCQYHLVGIIC